MDENPYKSPGPFASACKEGRRVVINPYGLVLNGVVTMFLGIACLCKRATIVPPAPKTPPSSSELAWDEILVLAYVALGLVAVALGTMMLLRRIATRLSVRSAGR
jgi:hypothetical protein